MFVVFLFIFICYLFSILIFLHLGCDAYFPAHLSTNWHDLRKHQLRLEEETKAEESEPVVGQDNFKPLDGSLMSVDSEQVLIRIWGSVWVTRSDALLGLS